MKTLPQNIRMVMILLWVSFALMGKSDKLTVLADETAIYDIPQITINTTDSNGVSLVKETGYVAADISVLDVNGQEISEPGQVKVRGNSTALLPKKPYTIKFDTKQDVLGMGKAKKWVLLANSFDKSFLRNYLAFSLADQLNLHYTSSCAFVDVYMDGTYLGNYLLTEQVEEGASRVDIDSANGDFLLEYEAERTDPDDIYVHSPIYNYRFILHEPEDATEEQLTAVSNALKAVEMAISTNDMTEIAKVIDVESFVDFYVFNEYIKTVDFGFASTRFYYKDGVLYAGPAWDYDQSMGNAPSSYGDDREKSFGNWCYSIWYEQLMQNEQFKNMCINRFIELQDTFKGLYEENGFVDQAYARYKDAFERDNSLAGWSQEGGFVSSVTTLDGQIAFLKNWLQERNEWLYNYWDCDNISINYMGYYCAVELTRGLTAQNFSNYEAVCAALNVNLLTDSVTQEEIDAAEAQLLEAVRNGEMIEPETTVIAAFEMESGTAGDGLPNVISATGGGAADSILTATMDGDTTLALVYSKAEYKDGEKKKITVPILEASESDTWTENAGFIVRCSTSGASHPLFTAALGATKKGARDFVLQYSLDGTTYTDIRDSGASLTDNKTMQVLYSGFALPEECGDQEVLYIRVKVASNQTVGGSDLLYDIETGIGTASGEIAINHISVTDSEQSETHRLVHVKADAPSCTQSGHTEFWYCGDCGIYFTDVTALESIPESGTILTALGHHFTKYVSDGNATCEADGTKTATCDRCNVTDTVEDTGSILSKVPEEPEDKKPSTPENTVETNTQENVTKPVEITPPVSDSSMTAAAGEAASVTRKTEIENAAKNTSAVVTTVIDADGTTSSAKATVTRIIGDSSKVSITGSIIKQVVEAAGTDSVDVTVIAKDSDGKNKYKIKVNTADMTAGSKLVAYRLNTKTGEYIMVNDKSYTVSDKGTVSITMTNNRTYALVTEKKAKSINKVIKATVKPAKSTITVKAGKTAVIKLSTKLNTANVKSITYTSSKKSVATVGKNGKVTAKKAGTTTIKIEVTLKNGSSKTVKTVVKVTSKS